jgi:glycosyltransferase involved in cell wall biosynthesis
LHLAALVDSPEHVCCRYRLAAYRPFLEQAGHCLSLHSLPRSWRAWRKISDELGPADAVVLQRRLLPASQLRLLRRVTPRLLFDFDDAVFLRDSYSTKGLHSGRRLRRFAHLLRQADAVVAGNTFLQTEAARWTAANVHVIPTCVDPMHYPLAQHQRAGVGVELVWVGSSSTLKGLEAIRSLLEDWGLSWPGLCLKLICDRFLTLDHLPVVKCPWSEATEAAHLAAADIGISWLPDDWWSRGKCGLKVLQYMAAGLPVVANPVGVQAEMVRHGETGFLVGTPGEWSMAIGRLAHDPDLRRRLGQAGRQRLEREYSVTAGAQRWLSLLDHLADKVPLQQGAA